MLNHFFVKDITLSLLCAACLLTTGCDVVMPKTTARVVAKPYVEPVLEALEAYHQSHNQYPKTLDELRSEYPKALEGLQSKHNGALYEKLDGRFLDWGISYKQETPESYLLIFERGETDAAYRNGKLVSSNSNWTR